MTLAGWVQDGRPIISIHTSGEAAQDTVPPTTSLTAEQSTEVSAVTQQQQQQPSNHGQILQRHVEASGVVPQILLAEHGRLSSHGQIASQLSDFTFLASPQSALCTVSCLVSPLSMWQAAGTGSTSWCEKCD